MAMEKAKRIVVDSSLFVLFFYGFRRNVPFKIDYVNAGDSLEK